MFCTRGCFAESSQREKAWSGCVFSELTWTLISLPRTFYTRVSGGDPYKYRKQG